MSAVLQQTVRVQDAERRYNIYTIIHKGLRAFMSDTLLKVGKMDVRDECQRRDAIEQISGLLSMCAGHLQHENEIVHPAIERAHANAAARTAEDHVHHELAIAKLRKDVAEFCDAPAELREVLAQRLYRSLSTFVADNFQHMLIEEIENHAELIAAYSDAEILDIERRIVTSITPEESLAGMRWMIPFINHGERVTLLGGMRQSAPPPAFAAVMNVAREHLTQRDYYELERALMS